MLSIRTFAIFAISVLLAAALQPALAQSGDKRQSLNSDSGASYFAPATASTLSSLAQAQAAASQYGLGINVPELIAAAAAAGDTNDTDNDTLPDSVEAVIGTDYNNSDSDFDRLSDYEEVANYSTDPLEPDSNGDRFPDYFEVTNLSSLDLDGDGFPNAWDFDNDGDAVIDALDISPFALSATNNSFHFDIKTNGNPTYISFQLRPEDPEHLKLPNQTWDWPDWDKEGFMKDMDDSKEDVQVFPQLEFIVPAGMALPDESEVEDYGITIASDRAYIPLFPVLEHGAFIALTGKMIYPEPAPLDLSAEVNLIWRVVGVTDNTSSDGGYVQEKIILATYNESFMLTGFSVEEHYGSDIGVFYSDDVNDTIAADLALAYHFLRNSTTRLSDMPHILAGFNVSVMHQIRPFSHGDEAYLTLVQEMIPNALDSLPEGQNLPIITAFEYNSSSLEMSELLSGSYIMDDSCVADLTAGQVVTSKTLETSWHNTSTNAALEIEDVMMEINGWGLDQQASLNLMNLMLIWNAGELTITQVGSLPTDFEVPELPIVGDAITQIIDIGVESLSGIYDLSVFLKAYSQYRFLHNLPELNEMTCAGFWRGMSSQMGEVSSIKTGSWGRWNTAGKVFLVIGALVGFGMSYWTMYTIGQSYDWSALGIFIALTYALMLQVYTMVLTGLGVIPVVGWLIALGIALSDLAFGWVQEVFDEMIDFMTDVRMRLDITVEFKDQPLVNVTDYDNNGLTVGDQIEYRGSVISNITKTGYGEWRDVRDSYYRPSFKIYIPYYYYSNSSSFSNKVSTSTDDTTWRAEEYDTGVRVNPGVSMPNFPATIWLSSDYWIYYDLGTYSTLIWDWGWHWDRMHAEGTADTDKSMIFFDVLPTNVSQFAHWYAIVPLDHDGDGLKDNPEDINPWRWDTDEDGLNDKFEIDIGTNPAYWDTDRDGLSDSRELLVGTNATNRDTEGDGLPDYVEYAGWLIKFNYTDTHHEFTARVHSDPLRVDTDGDGVDDLMEYWSTLNPSSQDTDGDGIMDIPKPGSVTYIEFAEIWGWSGVQSSDLGRFNYVSDIAVDAAGRYVYVADIYNHRIQKFDADQPYHVPGGVYVPIIGEWVEWGCNLVDYWGTYGNGAGQFNSPEGVAVDANGYVYVADTKNNRVQKFDSDGNYLTEWGPPPDFGYPPEYYKPTRVAIDNLNGYVYVSDGLYREYVYTFDLDGTYLTRIGGWAGSYPGFLGKFNGARGLSVDSFGNLYVVDNYNDRVQKFDSEGNFTTALYEFYHPGSIAIDADGYLYVSDSYSWGPPPDFAWRPAKVYKFDSNGMFIASYAPGSTYDGQWGVTVDHNGYIYVGNIADVMRLSQRVEFVPPEVSDGVADRDGDGLASEVETTGWDVLFTNSTGTYNVQVTSDPLIPDTDGDGLNDYEEYNMSSNPGAVDTDGDGLSDYEENMRGTNITHYDTDGDGLEDGTEITYGSDPTKSDTDGEGLSDIEEFQLQSNPDNPDTDADGLNDSEEEEFGSNLANPDSDQDFMFDGQEYSLGTNPQNPDSDNDDLSDGYEILYNTNPLNGDTDGDAVNDGEEVELNLNPLLNDTDNDGLLDSTELEMGTNPRRSDSDGDGIPDSQDYDSAAPGVEYVILAFDPDSDTQEFVENLAKYTNVSVVSPEELLSNYSDAHSIVLVGRPDSDGPVGNIIHDLLEDAGDVLTKMTESDLYRFAVRYGRWNQTQTIVLLSHPYPSDHYRVLDILKSRNVTILPDSIAVAYQTPQWFFEINTIDTLKETDSVILVGLETPVTPSIKLSRYDASTTPFTLGQSELTGKEEALGRYLEVKASDNVQNETGDIISGASVMMYYTALDLDRTGDGDADDALDVNESTLRLYFRDESTGGWSPLPEDVEWVYETGVNTTNLELYGESYEGYVWALISHFSMYGLAGAVQSVPVANANGPYIADEGSAITFNGSGSYDPDDDPLQYRWDFNNDGGWDTEWSSDPTASYTWDDDRDGMAKLEVSDGELTSTDTAIVTVNNVAPSVEAGPDQIINKGGTVEFKGSFTDSGANDTHTILWDFGDGGTATGNLNPTHAYSETGVYTVTLTVTDDDGGAGSDTLKVTVVLHVVKANVVIKPETLNLKSRGIFIAFIRLPKGYNAEDINVRTVVCEGAPALGGFGFHNTFIAWFKVQDLVNVPPGDAVALTVTGTFYNGTPFTGSDTIRIIDKGMKKGKR